MPHPRRVNFAYTEAVSHADAIWHKIVEHVKTCQKKCSLTESPGGASRFVAMPGCDWGQAFAEEWFIAVGRREAAKNSECGGTAHSTN